MTDVLKEQINDLEEEIAMEFSSLYFQNEMLKEEEQISMLLLIDQLMKLFNEGVDYISWGYIYPVIKDCVKKDDHTTRT